ncbi:response regulator [Paraglaciecola hydrolytica]|uniref:histidine kinase n=1 Tax=Paraglaciecola hydrolytica TaxID=1799789 RepID=A0A136A5L5_9ALTE|nr:response regulator [Paraglaciecola hydrolytica]KXI30527.1 histidine kinase [Paraglaciecola hydrolytica]
MTQMSFAASTTIVRFNVSEFAQQDISQQLRYFKLSENQRPIPQLSANLPAWLGSLTPHQKTNTFGDAFLSIFEIYNDSQQSEWFVYPYGSVIANIEIHSFDANKALTKVLSGHDVINQEDFHYGARLTIKPGQSKTIMLVFKSDYFFAPTKILVQPYHQLVQQFNLEKVLILLCLGICLALGVFNLFIFWVVKQYQYLHYALATLAFTLGWASVFGLPEFMGLGSSTSWLMPSYIIGAFFSCYFYMQFLKTAQQAPRTTLAFKITAAASLLALPFAFYNQGLGLYLASILTSAALFIGLYAGLTAWRQGYTPARYFIWALLAVLLPNSVGNLMNLGILPGFNINIYLLGLIGNSLDSLLLAFALAAQVRLLNLKNIDLTTSLEHTVEQRTKELTQANLQLEQTNSELLEANLAKGRFLATMSHEIRTPLTSIIGYADGILMGDIDKSEQERVTKIIAENGNHLLAVINDILDISKIEANKLEFEAIPTPLFAVLAQIESVVGKRARDKGLAFHLDYQYPLPAQIYTDPTRLRQILFNLTNNALKFTEQGFIGLSVAIEHGQLSIKVKDSGEGISTTQLKQLFQPFAQADSSINRRKGGTGLGLSISQRLARGLGGDIQVDSVPRKGSTFSLHIDLNVVENSPWISSVSEIWQATPTKTIKTVSLPDFSGNRVLLADDHPSNRELIAILLRRMNISVTEVENGQQVLDTLFYQQFDLLLLDIHMPQLDGCEALKQIRAAGNHTPVIALTANNMKHEVQHYLRLGFSDHLAKPLSRHHFVAKLAKYLSKHSAAQSHLQQKDMLVLIRDYQQELLIQLQKIESAWQQKDLTQISEVAHRIRGSASSFGFDLVSEKFADIEQSALQDDEIALSYTLPKALLLSRQCANLPQVDIPQGIVNHHNSVEQFLYALYELLNVAEHSFQDMLDALADNTVNSALVYLNDFQPHIKKCALLGSIEACEQLEVLFIQGDCNPYLTAPLIQQLKMHLSQLKHALSPNILTEL